ncbi:MAG: iron-containing alcohol dehydrogenase [bacterium]|nr:iron-containing alcohol dehydrogenase [bacterium]
MSRGGRVVSGSFHNCEIAVLVTDEVVAKSHLPTLTSSLNAAGIETVEVILKPKANPYELEDTFPVLHKIAAHIRNGDKGVIAALGGRSIGSVAGFVAATYFADVPWVFFPTTSSGQCDGLVCGSVALGFENQRDILTLNYAPTIVAADPLCLRSVPKRVFRSGLVEMIKCALLNGHVLFDAVEAAADIITEDSGMLDNLVKECLNYKAELCKTTDGGRFFDVGRVFGKAFEKTPGLDFNRGESDAAGLVYSCLLSELLGTIQTDDVVRVVALLKKLGLPTYLPNLRSDIILIEISSRLMLDGYSIETVSLHGIGQPRVESIPYPVYERFLPQIHQLARDMG